MLPKIDSIINETELPIQKTKIKFRPYTLKEEKILLIALKSEDPDAMVAAVKQVITNCVITTPFDVEALETFDLEYLLVELRIASVSNILELKYKDEDGQTYDINVDLPKALKDIAKNVVIPEKVIVLNEVTGVGIEMKNITIDMLLDSSFEDINDPEKIYEVLPIFMKHVFDSEQIYKFEDATKEQIEEFFDSFNREATQKLSKYFDSIPRLYYEVSYTNSKGIERIIPLNGLSDFFQ